MGVKAAGTLQERTAGTAAFDVLGSRFLRYYETTQGIVRREVVRANLLRHLPASRSAHVLDLGCGEGLDAVWLVQQGYSVTAVDESAEMLRAASRSAATLTAAERRNLRLVHGSDRTAMEWAADEGHDVVLCHGVVMYQDDDERFVGNLSRLVRGSGVVSILAKNSRALAYRSAAASRYAEARRLLGSPAGNVGRLGVETSAHTIAQLEALLGACGLSIDAWFGVKVFSDAMTGLLPRDELDELIRLEVAASRVDPYRSSGRLTHVIASRP